MSQPTSGVVRFQDDPHPRTDREANASDTSSFTATGNVPPVPRRPSPDSYRAYLVPPALPDTSALLSNSESSSNHHQHHGTSAGNQRRSVASSGGGESSALSSSPSSARNRRMNQPAAPADCGELRPQRSLVMSSRLRRHRYPSPPPPQPQAVPAPSNQWPSSFSASAERIQNMTLEQFMPMRRGATYRKAIEKRRNRIPGAGVGAGSGTPGSGSEAGTAELDTSGLLNYPDGEEQAVAGDGGTKAEGGQDKNPLDAPPNRSAVSKLQVGGSPAVVDSGPPSPPFLYGSKVRRAFRNTRPRSKVVEDFELKATELRLPSDLANIDADDHDQDKSDDKTQHRTSLDHPPHHHPHEALTDFMHGYRPDRNLFPYRNTRDNWKAARTFIRRFFLVLLIIPAWIVPNVLMAQMERELELKYELAGETMADTGPHSTMNNLFGSKAGTGREGLEEAEEKLMLSKWVNVVVFVLNMLAMMHLGKAAGACLEELVPKLGMSIVSVFDAMTSSSVELAVAAFALLRGHVRVVQAACLGAILNNLLLMLGIALSVGGFYHHRQEIQADTSQTGMNILMIACISYVIPVALAATFKDLRTTAALRLEPSLALNETAMFIVKEEIRIVVDHDILTISKIMAIIMLILYGCCLLFQYRSRTFMVTPEAKHQGPHTVHKRHVHYWFAGFGYSVMLTAQIYSANLLVHSVESLGKQFALNDSFVGFVLLPIVLISDLQEEVIAIRESRANRMDRSIALMIGSCMQISLLVTPLLVILGWIIDVPMTLQFTVLEAVIFAGSVLIVNFLLQDNETHWLEGCMLLAAFFMCALAFYYDTSPFEAEAAAEGIPGGAGGHGGGIE